MVFWKKNSLSARSVSVKFNTLGCGHPLFPLTGSRGKRTREPASAKSPMALKRDARVEPARKSPNAASNFYVQPRVVLAGLILSGKSRPSSLSGTVEGNEQASERAQKSPVALKRVIRVEPPSVGHFRVVLCLFFKARPGAQPFI